MFSPQFSPSVFCCSANSVRPSSSLRARIRVSTSPTRIEGFEESHLSVATSAGKFRPRGRFRSSQLVGGAVPSSSIRSTASASSWKANSIRPSSSGRALTRARRSIPWSCATRSAANPAIRRAAKVATNSFVNDNLSSVLAENAQKALCEKSDIKTCSGLRPNRDLYVCRQPRREHLDCFSDHLLQHLCGWPELLQQTRDLTCRVHQQVFPIALLCGFGDVGD